MATTTSDPVVEQLQKELQELRREMDRRVAALEAALKASQSAAPVEAPAAAQEEPEEVSPETIAIIAAALTSYLGKKVRVRSARRIYPGSNPWAQQGRVFVQASHNLSR